VICCVDSAITVGGMTLQIPRIAAVSDKLPDAPAPPRARPEVTLHRHDDARSFPGSGLIGNAAHQKMPIVNARKLQWP